MRAKQRSLNNQPTDLGAFGTVGAAAMGLVAVEHIEENFCREDNNNLDADWSVAGLCSNSCGLLWCGAAATNIVDVGQRGGCKY